MIFDAKNITIAEGLVSRIIDPTGVVLWKKEETFDYSKEYFTIESVASAPNVLTLEKYYIKGYDTITATPSYSYDKVNWTTINTFPFELNLQPNVKVYFKSNDWNASHGMSYFIFKNTNYTSVSGNIMSLIYSDDFADKTEMKINYQFCHLFYENDFLVNAANLILPSKTLTTSCYSSMFNRCKALQSAPALPATTLASECYKLMFQSCELLTTAPALPATQLANSCYYSMFAFCNALTTAPALPATELKTYCYQNMFHSCTSLTEAPALPATTLASQCYYSMFQGCTALTIAPSLPATTLADYCYKYMLYNCFSLTEAPELPATELTTGCYSYMFYGDSKLSKVTTYANDISATDCLLLWLYDVSNTGDFYNLGTATYKSGISGIPSGWTEHTSL